MPPARADSNSEQILLVAKAIAAKEQIEPLTVSVSGGY